MDIDVDYIRYHAPASIYYLCQLYIAYKEEQAEKLLNSINGKEGNLLINIWGIKYFNTNRVSQNYEYIAG